MSNAEALQQSFQRLEKVWATPTDDADKTRGQAVRRIWQGETLKFVYHEFSNREPVDRIIKEAQAVGQQDLGLFIEPVIHIWKPIKRSEL